MPLKFFFSNYNEFIFNLNPEFFRLTNSRTKALSKTVHSLPSRLSLPFDYSAVMLSHTMFLHTQYILCRQLSVYCKKNVLLLKL